MGFLDYYLIGINILGFVLYLVNFLLYTYTAEGQIDTVLTITSLLGGSLGIVLAILLFDRKSLKGNMMSRVFVTCMLIIQIIVVLILKGYVKSKLTFAVWEFFGENKIFLSYLLIINIVTFIVFALDKAAAIEHRYRISIVTLLGLALIGGSIGALVAMYLLRHKTQKDYFSVGVPLIVIMQAFVIFFLMNGQL